MTDQVTGKRIVVRPVRDGGATFDISKAQLPAALGVLERHGFFHWRHDSEYTMGGVWFTGVDVSQKEDPAAVQAALDAAE
jgi:hypothetical protein